MRTVLVLSSAIALATCLVLWMSCAGPEVVGPADDPPVPTDGAVEPDEPPHDPGRPPPDGPVPPQPPRDADPPEPASIEPAAGAPDSLGEVPAEELGSGPCTLVLRLVDASTGEPVSSGVRLWRLGVPASGAWSAGDHVQRHVEVPAGGATLKRLPAGRYRVEADGAAAGAPDGPEFLLDGARTERTERVALPAPLVIRCAVYDESGAMIRTARHRRAPGGWGAPRVRAAPEWSTPRRRPGSEPAAVVWSSILTSGSVGPSAAEIEAGAEGFEVGTLPAATRVVAHERSDLLLFGERNSVRVHADSRRGPLRPFVAVSVPVAELVAHVRLPGSSAALDPVHVTAECVAVPAPEGDLGGLLRTLPVSVSVNVPGYAPTNFAWRASAGRLPDVTLAPLPE